MAHRSRLFVGLLLTASAWLLATPTNAQGCAPSRVLLTDDDVQQLATDLSSKDCSSIISADLDIGSPQSPCTITSLSPINSIVEVRGSLTIQYCAGLTDIADFQNLGHVTGSVFIYFNRNLAAISGFISLRNVTSLQISQNPKLERVSGFSSLSVISGYLEIDRNPILYDLGGFRFLRMIQGAEIILGHALTLTYNTNLTSLSGFVSLSSILSGTVHVEGNTRLCYAGYPQWRVGSYPVRPEVVGGVDVGIDWRSRLGDSVAIWEYTWNVVGGGYPTLLIQNNAPLSDCGGASCDPSCPPGAGCLGPNDSNLCGTCRQLDDGSNICNAVPTSAPGSTNSTAIALGIVIPLLVIILLVLLALGIWGAIVLSKRWRESKQGSFDIVYTPSPSSRSVDSESGVKLISRSSPPAEQIVEPTPTGSSATRKGLRRQPMDNVVMASYQANTSSLSHSKPTRAAPATPTRAAPPPSSGAGGGGVGVKQSSPSRQRPPPGSSHSPPPPPPTTRTHTHTTDHPMTAKRAPTSRSPPQATRSTATPTSVAASSSARSNGVRTQQPHNEEALEGQMKELSESDVPMNFPRDQIKLGKEFGEGDFGKVFQAEAKKLLPGHKKTTVVVKQLKEGATKEERDVFLRPVEAMKILRHRNVLSLLGVSMPGSSILVLLEYCAQGNFKTFLVRKRREAAAMKQSKQLIKMACDMAAGLHYLHSKSIAHNDFAVRSCMVTEDGVVKLGDYGITRQTFKEDYYSRGKNQRAWPVRWMAPEQIVIQGRNILDSLPASVQANVWSFGVALWEVCSFAQWPYEEMGNEEVIQTVKSTGKCFLDNPLQPNDLIAPLFNICLLCWQPFDNRPSMSELLTTLKDILAGGKVRWPTKKGGMAIQQGESPSGGGRGRSGSSSSGHRPKRPAPTKPPISGATHSRQQKEREKEQSLVIGNLAAHSQEDPTIEQNVIAKSASLSQDTGTGVYVDSERNKERASKTHKQALKRDLSSSTEPLLESSPSLSAEDDSKTEILPVPIVPPAPPAGGDSGVNSSITEQKKRKRRKYGEFKTEGGDTKQKSKAKHKRRTEHDTSEKKTSISEEGSPQQTSLVVFKMSEPSAEEGELPLPQEIAEAAAINEAVIAGVAGVGEGDQEVILEPPLRFSQSSVDYLDEFGDVDQDSGPLSFDFAPPTAPSDDELEPPPTIAPKKSHPPTDHEKQTQIHKTPQQTSEKKKSATRSLEAKKLGSTSRPQEHRDQEDEWQGLDYPVKNPPLRRAHAGIHVGGSRLPRGKGETRTTTFPRDQDNEFDEFAHRDALEEEPDDDDSDGGGGVVLDEDVAALLW